MLPRKRLKVSHLPLVGFRAARRPDPPIIARHIHATPAQDLVLPDEPAASASASTSSTKPSPAASFNDVRLRFAPSPTGNLHLGGLRTALFNHLLARKWGGKWILRIEDTDRPRFVGGSAESLMRTLEWSGLDYNEGPGRNEQVGPYVQSERLDMYHTHVRTLLDKDRAYHCFCSPAELASIQADQLKRGATTSYDGRCRHLSEEDVGRRKRAGEKFVVRFKAQDSLIPNPPDLIFGETHSPATAFASDSAVPADKDDFILLKSDGFPTYHLASVVDDAAMRISHVLRGEEWLPSTSKHVQLYDALGLRMPRFGHLPLLANANGSKLSKRSGDVAVEDYIKRGYEPEALLNFLALMGWDHLNAATANPTTIPFFDSSARDQHVASKHDTEDNTELFTLPGLIEAFDVDYVTKRRAVVNFDKLDWVNRMHLRRAGLSSDPHAGRDGLVRQYMALLEQQKVLQGNPLIRDTEYVGKVLDAELTRATVLRDLPTLTIPYFLHPRFESPDTLKLYSTFSPDHYRRVLQAVLNKLEAQETDAPWEYDGIWDVFHTVIKERGLAKKPMLLGPLRHAITGKTSGAALPMTMSIIGRSECIDRLHRGLEYAGASARPVAAGSQSPPPIATRSGETQHKATGVISALEARGLVQALTSPGIAAVAESESCVYSGVDPSASSLHLGNLLPLIVLLHLQLAGNKIIPLIGGATGSIGDPSGRSTERNALDQETLERNVTAIEAQVRALFDRGLSYAKRRGLDTERAGPRKILNNLSWTKDVSLLDFLRTVGKQSKVQAMLARDSVKNRLSSEQGISFTEFTYQLLQAFDFQTLYNNHQCRIQVGGSDQWGNIVAGIDLIHRQKTPAGGETSAANSAFGLTIPLLTTSTGEKFGKSAGNALWLDSGLTSVTSFYQYFFRTTDADVGRYLRLFTLLPLDRIERILVQHQAEPAKRVAQRLLADEVTDLVHGQDALSRAKTAMRVLFDSDLDDLFPEAVLKAFEQDDRLLQLKRADLIDVAIPRLLTGTSHAKSKSEATRLINSGGVSLNGQRVESATAKIQPSDLLKDRFAILKIGKASHLIIYATD